MAKKDVNRAGLAQRGGRSTLLLAAACFTLAGPLAQGESATAGDDLARLSLEELSNVEVTSVSKAP